VPKPKVIPKEHLDPTKRYAGYVARPEGLVSQEAEVFEGWGKDESLRFKKVARPVPSGNWGVEAVKRRTPQERVISLANRILAQYQKGGLTEGVFREVQQVCWELGLPATFEDAAALLRPCKRAKRACGKALHRPMQISQP